MPRDPNDVTRPVYMREAREWIRVTGQHRADLRKVRRFLEIMERGEWDPELHQSAPIKVHHNTLMDGHHRIMAVLFLGRPVMMRIRQTPVAER